MLSTVDVDVSLDESRTNGRIESLLIDRRRLPNGGEILHNSARRLRGGGGASSKAKNSHHHHSSSTASSSSPTDSASSMDFRKLMALVGAFYWLLMIAVVLPTACVSTLLLFVYPTMLFGISVFNRLEHELCRMVNDLWVAAGQYSGLSVVEYGDDIGEYADKRCLCLANHLGLIDHFCLMTAFYDKKSLSGKYLWVIFNIWKYTTLGLMWTAHGNFFINGGSAHRNKKLADFREHLATNYRKHDYGWVVMYPEGSRLFLIRDSEVEFCGKNGLQPFRHCAHPRSGAAFSALSVCAAPGSSDVKYDSKERMKLTPTSAQADGIVRNGKRLDDDTVATVAINDNIEYVVDCTLGYARGAVPELGDAMLGEWPDDESNVVAVHYRVHRVRAEWVTDEAKLRAWLYEQYKVKDDLLDDFYRTGRFPGAGRAVHFSLGRNVTVQAFWLALFYFHFNAWLRPLIAFAINAVWSIIF